MDAAGINQVQLGELMGCTKGNVTQLMDGTTQKLQAEYALRIEDRTNYCARWVAIGEGPKKIDDATRKVLEAMTSMSDDERQQIARMVTSFRSE